MIKIGVLLTEPVIIEAATLYYDYWLWVDTYVEGTVMQLHGTMTVIVCFDLHVCRCMVFRIYRALALSLATPGVQQRLSSGSPQTGPACH